ncbi:MAG: transcription elongation factor GreA [Microthrixaceae bacterium]
MPLQHELSQAAHDRLVAELEDLRTHGRIELADRIERAREHGDLKENAEYHSAKEEKSKMEARIAQIFGILENCTIVDASGSDKVMVGSIVTLRYDDEDDDEAERYLIGSIEEQTDGVNVISPNSPLGSALTGVAIGESVTYETPTGATLTVIVMGIE